MAKYPPYVNSYGQIPKLFNEIKKASVPPKFTNDFMKNVLGLKSSSYRAMIPLLKNLGFLDQSNIPTQTYRDFRDDFKSGSVLAERIRNTYNDVFMSSEYAYKISKKKLTTKLITLLGISKEDKNIPSVVGTLQELFKLADFDKAYNKSTKPIGVTTNEIESEEKLLSRPTKLGISYTINLNLPATTEIEVFNAIFKSLKEHILND